MKKKFCVFTVLVICLSQMIPVFASGFTLSDETLVTLDNYQDSPYFDELEVAYRQYSTVAEEEGKFVTISLEEFVCDYIPTQYYTINEYLGNAINELSACETIEDVKAQQDTMNFSGAEKAKSNDNITITQETRSAGGEWYYNCATLDRSGAYGKYKLLENTVTGDVVYDDKGSLGFTGHIAIVEGHYYSATYQEYYVRVVEAISDGVCLGILCDERVDDRQTYVYRVNTTTTNRRNAATWADGQIGKPWSYVVEDYWSDVSSSRSTWYCSLLCYAAYNAQGVNLADAVSSGPILPRQLIRSSSLSLISIS